MEAFELLHPKSLDDAIAALAEGDADKASQAAETN